MLSRVGVGQGTTYAMLFLLQLQPCVLPLQAFWGDGFDSCPWAGKAFFSVSSLAGVLITRWQGLFLDEGDGPRGSWYDEMCTAGTLGVCI